MLELLAFTITCKWWMLWLLVTIVTAFLAQANTESGGYVPDVGPAIVWLIFNLAMWLIYFAVT